MDSGSNPAQLHESHLRSIIKALSWRIIASCTTAGIAYFVTGQMGVALTIGGMELFIKILAYYLHERAWQMVPIGTIRTLYRWWNPSK
jgi:uncharacterized membrane protein